MKLEMAFLISLRTKNRSLILQQLSDQHQEIYKEG